MGMNPNAVMTTTQKIERFKKGTFQRKSSSKPNDRTKPFFQALEEEFSQKTQEEQDGDDEEFELGEPPPLTPIVRYEYPIFLLKSLTIFLCTLGFQL